MIEKLLNEIDMAHYVFVDKEGHRFFVWHGGTMVNVFGSRTGECIDAFTGDYENLTPREMHDVIMEHIQETS